MKSGVDDRTDTAREVTGPLVPIAFLGSALVGVDQITQAMIAVQFLDPLVPEWRFQVASLLVSRMHALALAAVLLLAAAQWSGHRRAARAAIICFCSVFISLSAPLYFAISGCDAMYAASCASRCLRAWTMPKVLKPVSVPV